MSRGELEPKPFRLKKKRGHVKLSELEPSGLSLESVDLTKANCYGVLFGQGVIVSSPHHIWALVRLGCYGKGLFSRSIPRHHRVPSSSELKQASRKRTNCGSVDMELGLWKKRVKLHSQWKEEGVCNTAKEEGKITYVQGNECMVQSDETTNEMTEDGLDTTTEDNLEMTKDEHEYEQFVKRLKTIKSEDLYALEEYLQLGPEEAFYLVAEAKVLSVMTKEAVLLTERELWVHLGQSNQKFCVRYAAYRHYRLGNWVPKSGLKFGVDFLLYKEGPLYYHSSFAVVVRDIDGCHSNDMNWRDIISLDRANEAAGKELVICQVTGSNAAIETGGPSSIDTMSIKDIFIRRWLPEKDREVIPDI